MQVLVRDPNIVPASTVSQAQQITGKSLPKSDSHSGGEVEGTRPTTPRAGRVLIISFVSHSETVPSGALAYARPFSKGGDHIVIIADRLKAHIDRGQQHAAGVLAHVFTHEITHMLQRLNRHSDSGLMKPRWTSDDFSSMAYKRQASALHSISRWQASAAGAYASLARMELLCSWI